MLNTASAIYIFSNYPKHSSFYCHDENNKFLIVTFKAQMGQIMIIDRYVLVQTCKESPEQYTVYKDGEAGRIY